MLLYLIISKIYKSTEYNIYLNTVLILRTFLILIIFKYIFTVFLKIFRKNKKHNMIMVIRILVK